MPRLSLVDVDVVDVRREPEAVPGGGRAHVVVLEERAGDRVLHIFIGEPEGRAMASTLTGFQTPRPMTYQLAASLVAALSGSVDEVRVVRLSENTYIAEVLLGGPSGTKVVDARPSDAINLALLTGASVRVASDVLDQWATASERADLDEYPDDAQAIRAELGSFFPASLEQLAPDVAEVIVLARQEAINRAHRAVGTGHILLAVLRRGTPNSWRRKVVLSPWYKMRWTRNRARRPRARLRPSAPGRCKCSCGRSDEPPPGPTRSRARTTCSLPSSIKGEALLLACSTKRPSTGTPCGPCSPVVEERPVRYVVRAAFVGLGSQMWSQLLVGLREPKYMLAYVGQDHVVAHRSNLEHSVLSEFSLDVVLVHEPVPAVSIHTDIRSLPTRLAGKKLRHICLG